MSIEPELWLERHGDVLWRYALSGVGDPSMAEDLIQETFADALASAQLFDGRSSERTWLISILRRRVVDHWRKVRRERSREPRAWADDDILGVMYDEKGRWRHGPEPLAGDSDEVIRERLLACVSQLSPSLENVIFLREIRGVDSERVCSMLSISSQTMWTRLHRARLWLRRCLSRPAAAGRPVDDDAS